jgi:phage terminase large subunit
MPNVQIEWKKQPRQIEFLRACGLAHPFDGGKPGPPKARIIFYGGAAGGGKSDSLLMAGVIAALSFPGCNVGYFRRQYPQLEGPGGAIMRSHSILNGIAKYNGSLRRWTFPNNSVIQFCHAKNEEDVYNYQSQQFDVLLIDESTHFTRFQVRYSLTRNRATVKGVIPFCALGSNPGNIGHGWHKKEFIDVGPPGIVHRVEVEPGQYETHLFIPSFLHDNQVLEQRDPGYRATLEAQPEEIRKALLEGDWNVFAGQYFKSFRAHKHVIDPFEIPESWQKFRAMDWGYAAPCAVLWFAVDPASYRVYVYKEIYITEKRPEEVADMILRSDNGEEIRYMKASPDIWQERGLTSKQTGGESIGEVFQQSGVYLESADNRRIMGWSRVRDYLADGPDGKPMLQIFNTCQNLIRTLPELIHDTRNVEDVDGNCEDHAPEALRYGLMSRPKPSDLLPFLPGEAGRSPHFDFTTEQGRDEYEDLEDENVSFWN